jgi:hypothetical protein
MVTNPRSELLHHKQQTIASQVLAVTVSRMATDPNVAPDTLKVRTIEIAEALAAGMAVIRRSSETGSAQ